MSGKPGMVVYVDSYVFRLLGKPDTCYIAGIYMCMYEYVYDILYVVCMLIV